MSFEPATLPVTDGADEPAALLGHGRGAPSSAVRTFQACQTAASPVRSLSLSPPERSADLQQADAERAWGKLLALYKAGLV